MKTQKFYQMDTNEYYSVVDNTSFNQKVESDGGNKSLFFYIIPQKREKTESITLYKDNSVFLRMVYYSEDRLDIMLHAVRDEGKQRTVTVSDQHQERKFINNPILIGATIEENNLILSVNGYENISFSDEPFKPKKNNPSGNIELLKNFKGLISSIGLYTYTIHHSHHEGVYNNGDVLRSELWTNFSGDLNQLKLYGSNLKRHIEDKDVFLNKEKDIIELNTPEKTRGSDSMYVAQWSHGDLSLTNKDSGYNAVWQRRNWDTLPIGPSVNIPLPHEKKNEKWFQYIRNNDLIVSAAARTNSDLHIHFKQPELYYRTLPKDTWSNPFDSPWELAYDENDQVYIPNNDVMSLLSPLERWEELGQYFYNNSHLFRILNALRMSKGRVYLVSNNEVRWQNWKLLKDSPRTNGFLDTIEENDLEQMACVLLRERNNRIWETFKNLLYANYPEFEGRIHIVAYNGAGRIPTFNENRPNTLIDSDGLYWIHNSGYDMSSFNVYLDYSSSGTTRSSILSRHDSVTKYIRGERLGDTEVEFSTWSGSTQYSPATYLGAIRLLTLMARGTGTKIKGFREFRYHDSSLEDSQNYIKALSQICEDFDGGRLSGDIELIPSDSDQIQIFPTNTWYFLRCNENYTVNNMWDFGPRHNEHKVPVFAVKFLKDGEEYIYAMSEDKQGDLFSVNFPDENVTIPIVKSSGTLWKISENVEIPLEVPNFLW